MKFEELKHALFRKKNLSKVVTLETNLKKCLSTFDLVSLGVACTLSSGIYVIVGEIIRNYTGPAVIISFLIAAFASALAAFSYAEFGARVPRAGSAYIYSYVSVGEVLGYVIGWNLVLEYMIGAASTAKSITLYLDALTNHAPSTFLTRYLPLHIPSLSSYPDIISFAFIIVLAIVVCFGVYESTFLNNIFVVINLAVLVFILVAGSFNINFKNWNIPPEHVPNPAENGKGGFFPFGSLGIYQGASICFYSYIGFDIITIAGEESMNAAKSVPIAIGLSLLLCTAAYIYISSLLTLMVPYYLISAESPISSAFMLIGWNISAHIINAGAILCLSSCLLSYMIAMPRIFYAMASDGLLFRFLSVINQRFKTPVYATLVAGMITAILAMFLDLIDLVNMMSIGTLLAYTLVSYSVLWLRYQKDDTEKLEEVREIKGDESLRIIGEGEGKEEEEKGWKKKIKAIFCSTNELPTKQSQTVFVISVMIIVTMTAFSTLMSIVLNNQIYQKEWWALLLFILPNLITLVSFIIVCLQPRHNPNLTFKVPLVPALPLFSMMANIYLMINLSWITWVRFVVWMVLGFIIYFTYSIKWSNENVNRIKQQGYTDIESKEESVNEKKE